MVQRFTVDGVTLVPDPAPCVVETIYSAPDADLLALRLLDGAGFAFAVLSRRTSWRRSEKRVSA